MEVYGGTQATADQLRRRNALRFGYALIYVPDVENTVVFYEKAFDLKRKFVHESGQYAEMETGATTLAFVSNELGTSNLPVEFVQNEPAKAPAGIEIAFVAEDVPAAFSRAVAAGATPLAEPTRKPWGQTVAYLRDVNGVLIEICTPM